MQYSIKDLNQHGISKTLVYEILKNSLPISNTFIKNKRLFNESDLKLFLFYKENWLDKTISTYWTLKEKINIKNDSKQFEESKKQFLNNEGNSFNQTLLNEIDKVKKQFAETENRLKTEIEQKNKIIEIKEEQNQKYALLKIEEKKEKEDWIKKYDAINEEKNQWIKNFYSLKTYLIVFIVLFMISLASLIAKIFFI